MGTSGPSVTAAAKRFTTFSFTLEPNAVQVEALRRHVGAARFAFNQGVRIVKNALDAKRADETLGVPWSGFDLINAFNAWKVSGAAGYEPPAVAGEKAKVGLPWRADVCQQVFEESLVDLGRALSGFSAARKGKRRGRIPGFPRYKKRRTARASFRIRNKGKSSPAVRLGAGSPRSLRLPSIGTIGVRECTRDLRRMLRGGRAKILFVTVAFHAGRWRAMLNVDATPFHPDRKHSASGGPPVGIDRGLTVFAVVADKKGQELERVESPRPMRESLSTVQREGKEVSRKKLGSRNRERAREQLARTHARMASVRRDFVHRLSSRLAKTHGFLVIEDLCIQGMMRTRLARAIADSAWSMFAAMLRYKVEWYGGTLAVADRFFPSTRRCSVCGELGEKLSLSERMFFCSECGHRADRDTNAAVNLANYLAVVASGGPDVAAKQADTQNGCGGGGSDATPSGPRETGPDEAARASA